MVCVMDDLPNVEPIKVFENTYKTGPDDSERFKASAAEVLMQSVLHDKLYELTNARDKKGRLTWEFSNDEGDDLAQEIVQDCHDKVKAELGETPRYKLLFQASVGELNGQALRMVARPLWDKDTDRCATATFTKGHVYAVVQCFALYYE